jgi:hypothetical protein
LNSRYEPDQPIVEVCSNWSALCRVCGIAALLSIVYLLEIMVRMVVLGGQPASAAETTRRAYGTISAK